MRGRAGQAATNVLSAALNGSAFCGEHDTVNFSSGSPYESRAVRGLPSSSRNKGQDWQDSGEAYDKGREEETTALAGRGCQQRRWVPVRKSPERG